jgi:UDP-glucuronate decarboxylase
MEVDRLFLTGGTGFFGRALLRYWLSLGEKRNVKSLTVFSRSPEKFLSLYPEFRGIEWVDFFEGDVTDINSFPKNRKYTHVIHAATDSTIGPQLSPLERFDQIYLGTRNVLDFSVLSGVDKFILTSSGGVYGAIPLGVDRFLEDYNGMPDPLDISSSYSIAKRAVEHLCAIYMNKYGLEFVIARCFSFIGKDLPLNVHFAVGNFINDALYNEKIIVKGDGSQIRSYLDQNDLAKWLTVLLIKGNSGEAYNIGSDVALSLAELAKLVRDILAPYKSIEICGGQSCSISRNFYVPDISKFKSQFGLDVEIKLEDSIRGFYNYKACS